MEVLFNQKILGVKRKLEVDDHQLAYTELSLLTKRRIVSPIQDIKNTMSYGNTYLIPLIICYGVCFVMSILIMSKFYGTNDWRMNLGALVFIVSCLFLVFIFKVGMKYGDMTIQLEGQQILVFMQEKDYKKVKEGILKYTMKDGKR